MGTTPEVWKQEELSTRPGPARIRVSFSRKFTQAEREYFRDLAALNQAYGISKMRLSRDHRLYIESQVLNSRELYSATAELVASTFVNVFPTAVRTFRERVVPPRPDVIEVKPHAKPNVEYRTKAGAR